MCKEIQYLHEFYALEIHWLCNGRKSSKRTDNKRFGSALEMRESHQLGRLCFHTGRSDRFRVEEGDNSLYWLFGITGSLSSVGSLAPNLLTADTR